MSLGLRKLNEGLKMRDFMLPCGHVILSNLSNNLMTGPKFYKFSKRTPFRFVIPSIRTSLMKNSYFHRYLTLWNRIVKCSPPGSLTGFKHYVRSNLFSGDL